MERLPTLSLLRAFERAAHHRSFKLAAEDLHLTPSAISHKVRQLETELGMPLFVRLTRALRLTPAGHAYFLDIQRAFVRIETGTRQLRERYGAKTLKLHLLPYFASESLIPRLHSFHERYPDVDIRIESAFGQNEVHPEDADLSVAIGDGRWANLVAHQLQTLALQPVCNARTAEQIDNKPENINAHTIIHFAQKPDAWQQWANAMDIELKPRAQLTVDSLFSALQGAEQGLGVGLALLPTSQEHVARSQLVAPFAHTIEIPESYYLLYRKVDGVRETVQQFVAWVLNEFDPDEPG